MKAQLFLTGILCLAVLNVHAAPLKRVNVNAPKINYLFSANGTVVVNDTVANIITNLPPFTPPFNLTNAATLSGFLQSRTYEGQSGTPEAGKYAYEYRLVLKSLAGVKSVSIKSMTLNFSPHSRFNYGSGANDDVYIVTSGGIGTSGLGSATISGSQVTFNFSPPLKITGASGEQSTYFLGMISSLAPPNAANAWASFTGLETLQNNTSLALNWLMIRVRTP